MTGDAQVARAALDQLIATFEHHFASVVARRGDMDPVVEDAYAKLADAFERYDEALLDAFDETTPFVLYDDDDVDDLDDDFEEFDEDDLDEDDDDEDDEDDDEAPHFVALDEPRGSGSRPGA